MIPRWKLPSSQGLQMKVEIYNISWQNRTKFNLLLSNAILHEKKLISTVDRPQTLGSCKTSGITWNYY